MTASWAASCKAHARRLLFRSLPLYLLSTDLLWIALGFVAQGFCAGGGMHGQMVPYLNECFPTEIRATAGAFC